MTSITGRTEGKLAHDPDIRREMVRAVADGVFPGAVLLWADCGEIMFHGAFGTMDLDSDRQVTPTSIYDLASLTKPLATTLAVAELIATGFVHYSTAVKDVIPRAEGTDKAEITVDMLLRHTSGLPAHRSYFSKIDRSDRSPRDSLRRMILAEPLEAAPGEKEVYSDLGFILLAWLVETASGQRLDRFVQQRIYAPLNIGRLFFNDLRSELREPEAVVPTSRCPWRGRVMTGEVEDENAWAAGGIEGHAGLFGDARSVFVLCREILLAARNERRKVLSPEVIQAFLRRNPGRNRVAGFDTPSGESSSAGSLFSRHGIGHLGFTGTSVWMDPETERIIVLLTNRVHPTRDNLKIRDFRPRIHDLISSKSNKSLRV